MIRNYYRTSKYQPLVNEVELIDANPSYAKIRYQDGTEANVSIKDLAPAGCDYVTANNPNDFISESPKDFITESTTDSIPENLNNDKESVLEEIVVQSDFKDTNAMPQTPPKPFSANSDKSVVHVNVDSSQNTILAKPVAEPKLRRSDRKIKPPDKLDL